MSTKLYNDGKAFHDVITGRVLDFGCGTGAMTEKISPLAKAVVGLDASGAMIEQFNKKKLANATGIACLLDDNTAKTTEALQQPFNLIIASSVISFVPDPAATIKTLHSLLAPGGILVQSDWLAAKPGGHGFTGEQVKEMYAGVSDQVDDVIVVENAFSADGMSTVVGAFKKK
eukprot:GFYU01008119.1.p1 GENE.GFYU01008119.1~~GFYU01008119.1.p1  ORF type:complete len:173 (-),score=65.13 GFYU01008119.1:73-591(-)